MSLDVKVLRLEEKSSVDFNDGAVTQAHFLHLELPGGEVVLALVDDAVAQKFLMAVQATRGVLREQPAPLQPQVQPQQPGAAPRMVFASRPAAVPPPSFEFGGEGALDEQEEDEPVIPPQFGPTLTRVRTPNADDAGNPVDATGKPLYENAPPIREEAEVDEDGVRSL